MSTMFGKTTFHVLAFFFFIAAAGDLFGQTYSRDLYLAENRLNGKDVLALQKKLSSLSFSAVGRPDGWFGPDTQTAVKQLQGWLGFPADGQVTQAVWNALFSPRVEARYFHLIKEANAVRLNTLRKVEQDLMGHSPEGGGAEIYFSAANPVYAVIRLYGEMSQVRYDVYRFKGDTYLVLETWARYPETFDLEHAAYEYTGYFYSRAASYSVKDGLPVTSAFDAIKVIELFDEALEESERSDIGD